MTNNSQKKTLALKRRRAISPILAVVVLLGITVVAGGIVFSLFSNSASSASATEVIAIQNAQAVKGSDHADFTATVKNAGSQPWTEIIMTLAKSDLSEPIIYESLHENVSGCKTAATIDGTCDGTGNGGDEGEPAGGRDNPLRAQWLISLDKSSAGTGSTRTDGVADKGEGASVGRKLVFQSKDDLRTIQVLNGTAVAPLFNGKDQNGNALYTGNIDLADQDCTGLTTAWKDCSKTFNALDPSTKGIFQCKAIDTDDDVAAECHVFTHTNIKDSPISPGQSVYFYADALTKEIPGLDNLIVGVGDNLVVNIATENSDGGTARVQTIIKVTGT